MLSLQMHLHKTIQLQHLSRWKSAQGGKAKAGQRAAGRHTKFIHLLSQGYRFGHQ